MRCLSVSSRCGLGLWVTMLTVGSAVGCASSDPRWQEFFEPFAPQVSVAEINAQRTAFQTDRTPAALDWLLAHQLESGMSVAVVNQAIGETGEKVEQDLALKQHGGQYQATDVGYKWGPDTNGRSVVLFFRDGKLVHFDPTEFQ
jgi:hypothetical protein